VKKPVKMEVVLVFWDRSWTKSHQLWS